ncbi:hypothetical protein [Streptomyces johnsoniae]|uniref:RCK N-terminal domain-containing protein n=1 Tax=Streptomyces johnsoniae TaxID=3075532 RepID=A0ABU2S0G2_9ACTN|nr:hypothetical protein [Streptomyces sp. DSM 41886]MDT0442452.1 hypothetical protein [Streptomyces sp. DSM 41886]
MRWLALKLLRQEHPHLHLITHEEGSARVHAEQLAMLGESEGTVVRRLSAKDSADARAAAYRADVVVGTVDDFAIDLGRESAQGCTRDAAVVVDGPAATAHRLLSAYQTVQTV